jgi:biotin carboxyl carrier protein
MGKIFLSPQLIAQVGDKIITLITQNNDSNSNAITISDDNQHQTVAADTYSLIRCNAHQYHLLYQGRSFNIYLHKIEHQGREMLLEINNIKQKIQLRTPLDEWVRKMGFAGGSGSQLTDLKAPMPGLIRSIKVHIGQSVHKGDPLLSLEAMKMENIIKATAAGTVKQIHVKENQPVEKNQLLISFN